MTERLHFHFSLSCTGDGNGNPFQCSCLENPSDGEPGGLPSMGLHRVRHDSSDLEVMYFIFFHLIFSTIFYLHSLCHSVFLNSPWLWFNIFSLPSHMTQKRLVYLFSLSVSHQPNVILLSILVFCVTNDFPITKSDRQFMDFVFLPLSAEFK